MQCEKCGNDMELEQRGGFSIWVCEVCDNKEEYEEDD